jgi:hypothetical protein
MVEPPGDILNAVFLSFKVDSFWTLVSVRKGHASNECRRWTIVWSLPGKILKLHIQLVFRILTRHQPFLTNQVCNMFENHRVKKEALLRYLVQAGYTEKRKTKSEVTKGEDPRRRQQV